MFAAMAFQEAKTIAMKIEGAIGRPGGELLEIVMDDVVRLDDRHFPAELGATPRPIKVGIGKRKVCGVESPALLPGFAANQERTGENHIASAPANSIARVPGRIIRRVEIQSRGEILPDYERQSCGKSHSVAKKLSVVLFNGEARGSEVHFAF